MQITTQRAHQFCALVRWERKSLNRKSKEVEELRLIYHMYVEREATVYVKTFLLRRMYKWEWEF